MTDSTNNGWIKLHRKLLDNPLMQGKRLSLWIILLLLASHTEQEVLFKGKRVKLKPGQFLTGRKFLAKKTGENETFVQRLLENLENEQQIEQQKSNKNRIITICNWQKYQNENSSNKQQIEQQMNNKRTTDEQQMNTYKKYKNVKNARTTLKNKIDLLSKWLSSFEDVTNPEGLAKFYRKKYSDDIIERVLKNSNCTTRAKFGQLCEHYQNS